MWGCRSLFLFVRKLHQWYLIHHLFPSLAPEVESFSFLSSKAAYVFLFLFCGLELVLYYFGPRMSYIKKWMIVIKKKSRFCCNRVLVLQVSTTSLIFQNLKPKNNYVISFFPRNELQIWQMLDLEFVSDVTLMSTFLKENCGDQNNTD